VSTAIAPGRPPVLPSGHGIQRHGSGDGARDGPGGGSALAGVLRRRTRSVSEGPLSHLSWMSGSWRGESPDGVATQETWLVPQGDQMLGLSQSTKRGAVTEYEFLRIAHEKGTAVLYASPGGRCPPTAFRMATEEGRDVVFENRDHDFPKRIQYVDRDGDLRVRIEGVQDGQPKVLEWTWKRVTGP